MNEEPIINETFGYLNEDQIKEVLDDTNQIIPLDYEDPNETDLTKIKVQVPGWGYGDYSGLTGGTYSGMFGCGAGRGLPPGYVNWISAVYDVFRQRGQQIPQWYLDKYPYNLIIP
jgi:hypothetical protein